MCHFGFSIARLDYQEGIHFKFLAFHFSTVFVVRNMTIQLSNELNPIFPFPTTLLGILDEKAGMMSSGGLRGCRKVNTGK